MNQSSRHGGDIRAASRLLNCEPKDVLDFSANINPLGPPAWLRSVVATNLSDVAHYPAPRAENLRSMAASRFGFSASCVTAGNGSSELLYALARVGYNQGLRRTLLPAPCYADYARAGLAAGLTAETLMLHPDVGFALDWDELSARLDESALVILGQPSNPAGTLLDPAQMVDCAARHPASLFVVDEAFADFVPDLARLACAAPNIFVLHSLTKFYAVPGLRLGLGYGSEEVISAVDALLPDWTVNSLAQAVGEAALQDKDYAQRSVEAVSTLRTELQENLAQLEISVFPGQANYLLCQSQNPDGLELKKRLFARRILIRSCADYAGLDGTYFRVAVRSQTENALLLEALAGVLDRPRKRAAIRRQTPAIMFQGLSSNAGKSVLTAALCRIFLQDGLTVMPFKAQNMSLNSFVTRDGKEMGRAQVLQAQACRMEPDVRMNPVLLKPNSDTGSQVIVLGRPVGNMDVMGYIHEKPRMFEIIKRAYDDLSSSAQVMVLEGAGSPAEVNLKAHDVVNMAMARYAGARVLLAGDIDRGGVFASFVGTMEVMEEWERALVAGFVINRFRGRQDLLQNAIEYVQHYTGVETLGVVPYMPNLGLPEEDSVSFKELRPVAKDAPLRIVAVDLPHISNFTDLDALRLEPDVDLHVARRPEDLDDADAVILPGSRNVFADLDYLWERGLAHPIVAAPVVVGICGGLQMLGTDITDPEQVESGGRQARPLGMLSLATEMAPAKVLRQTCATFAPWNAAVRGYEIHHGRTTGQAQPIVLGEDGEVLGWGRDDLSVWGTYLHGVFDNDAFRRKFLDDLRVRKGLKALGAVQAVYDVEAALDHLAAVVRQSLDMHRIYKMIGL